MTTNSDDAYYRIKYDNVMHINFSNFNNFKEFLETALYKIMIDIESNPNKYIKKMTPEQWESYLDLEARRNSYQKNI
jgi:hypothetical protein